MHTYKPVQIDVDNLSDYNKYFGYLENNMQCFVAPERWYSQKGAEPDTEALKKMDVFSTACVVFEILTC